MPSKNESLDRIVELAVRVENLRCSLATMDQIRKELREAEAELLAAVSGGEPAEVKESGISDLILGAMATGEERMTVGDLIAATGKTAPSIRQALSGLVKRGHVVRTERGVYMAVKTEI